MRVIAVIQDIDETKHILRHLIKIGRAPPGLDESSVNLTVPRPWSSPLTMARATSALAATSLLFFSPYPRQYGFA